MSVASSIREFFHELFGSRLNERLEEDLIRLRQDFEERLQEKDHITASLREEKSLLTAKITMYEMTLMPHASRAGAEVVAYQKPTKPSFNFLEMPAPQSKWQAEQARHEKQMREELAQEAAATVATVRNFAGEQGAG